MKRFKVTVTQDDINNGGTDYGTDPVALALKRRFRNKKAGIGFVSANVGSKIFDCQETKEFIEKIIKGDKVEPTVFWFTEFTV